MPDTTRLVALLQSVGVDHNEAQTWLARWLNEPLPAWGGERPMARMTTLAGQEQVMTMLRQILDGTYA